MKRLALIVCAARGMVLSTSTARAGALSYSGYQPLWNIFADRPKCTTPEEERLQHFWHDYYNAMSRYYCALDHIDWVAYYKNHGYQINGGCGPCGGYGGKINYAPVFVSPTMQWAVPNRCLNGPPAGPCASCPPGGGYGPPYGGPPPYT